MEETPTALAALVARIDRTALAEGMLATFRTAIPGYERLPDTVVRGQILDIIRDNLDLCLDWVAGGAPPSTERFAEFRASAKNRATEGMPLEDLLRAYRMGGTAAWKVLVAEADADAAAGERDALPRAAELVMEYLDRATGTVAEAYLEERSHLVSEEERGLRALLDVLLAGEPPAAGHHATAERLGFVVAGEHAVFAVGLPGEGARAHARVAAGLRGGGTLALTEGDRVVGLAAVGRAPGTALPPEAVAVVDAAVARDDLAASLADVRLGLDVAVRAGRTGAIALPELALEVLLARAPRVAADLRRRALAPLGEGELLETVTTYVELRRDRKRTAELLHIHPNTLDHRLRRVRELTGLSLDVPEDLTTVVLALRAPA
ncbi:MAG TPA: helix-turn-helix domain-containing protein [Baekduia sp.]|uniref:PucR family transcriptional regulator n=1 Tax=Baekduia sp. TaxID=2600305 RepID=UPI002D77F9C2|nr:helix-turn-helix domain-containing protein [Baekduia sp.]HET6507100.1 helix-turn-helix domain-containing protein [Baekduia sp.]